jgi:hypothetical protein
LAQVALTHPAAQRLMTIPGVDVAVALGLVAAIGPITRFRSPQKLVSYLGLNPRVRQSGLQPAHHGRITKQGRAHARGMLVEVAWVAAKTPGPLRAFFLRIRGRRGEQIAAVATARKLAVLVWHLLTASQDYAWGRPLLAAQKRRALELRAGLPARRGQRGATHGYNLKERRDQEREIGAHLDLLAPGLRVRVLERDESSGPPLPLRWQAIDSGQVAANLVSMRWLDDSRRNPGHIAIWPRHPCLGQHRRAHACGRLLIDQDDRVPWIAASSGTSTRVSVTGVARSPRSTIFTPAC